MRLGDRRLLIVVDQFEEFLILKDEDRQSIFRHFLVENPIGSVTFLLVYRPEYEGLIQDLPLAQAETEIAGAALVGAVVLASVMLKLAVVKRAAAAKDWQ